MSLDTGSIVSVDEGGSLSLLQRCLSRTNQHPAVTWMVAHSGGSIKNAAQVTVVLVAIIVIGSIVVALNLRIAGSAKIVAPPGYKVIYPDNTPARLEKI